MVQLRLRKDQRVDALRRVGLFSSCSVAELGRIAALATESSVRAGHLFTKRGQVGSEFFVIIDGKASASRKDVKLAALGPGSFFGELALLDGGKRTATVVAETDMRVLVLTKQEFSSLCRSVPSVAINIMKELGLRLRKTDELVNPLPALSKSIGPWSL